MKCFCTLVLLMLNGWLAPLMLAQPQRLRFERLNVEDGLSQISVYAIAQDRRGFMWFGMENGLNRYDGYTFKAYASVPFDTTSLLPDHILDIEEARDGALWIASAFQGVSRFDPATETATHYRHDPKDPSSLSEGTYNEVLEARDGAVWVGTRQGLSRMDPRVPGRFTHYVHDPADSTSLSHNDVLSLFEDAAGTIWVSTPNGLNRMDPDAPGRFTRYLEGPRGIRSENHNRIPGIYEDPSAPGVLWMGSGNGLIRLDTETGEAERYHPSPDNSQGNVVAGVAPDPTAPGFLWATVNKFGIVRFDMETGAFTPYRHDPKHPHSLPDDGITSILTDRAGVVWIGHLEGGISRFDPTAVGFQVIQHDPNRLSGKHIYGIHEVRDGRLWVSFFEGGMPYLQRIDRATGDVVSWTASQRNSAPSQDTASPNGIVYDMIEDRAGILWLGTAGGLDRYDPATNRFTHYRSGDRIFDLLDGGDGTFWVGTGSGGVDRFDPTTRTTTRLWSGGVVSLLKDKEGIIWAGLSSGGIVRLDPATGEATRYRYDPTDPTTISSDYVYSMVERATEPGILWIASSGGLNRLEVSTGVFTHYTTEDGLPENAIKALLEDKAGMLWMSTMRGIARFDPDTGEVRTFGLDHGLQGFEFHAWSSAKGRDGELFFGGVNGLNAFYPSQITANQTPSQVALTGFRLFNHPVVPSLDGPLKMALSKTEEIRLRHENHVDFDYVALHFKNPEKNRYAYRLEGFDRDWIDAGTDRTARYTNLPSGRYTFRVKAANSDGVWNEEGASVGLVITPPWWRTWWAYGLYGLLLMAGVFGVYQWQHARIVRREREKAHKVLEKAHTELEETHTHLKTTQAQLIQAEKMASLGQLTAGIAHEIKNPLNFVNNFAEVNEELARELREALARGQDDIETVLTDLESNARQIAKHGRRADAIVQGMMAHASGRTGERYEVGVNALVDEYVNLALGSVQARSPDLAVRMERSYDEAAGHVMMAPQEMGRVLVNLLGNAFDAVQGIEGPKVTVCTQRVDGHVEIRVSDNGLGIPTEIREKIFEPFFTTKPTGQGSTGLGLSLSYDIVTQGHGGTLAVESRESDGATFVVTLPA